MAAAANSPAAVPAPVGHPSGRETHGPVVRAVRAAVLALYFLASAIAYAPPPSRRPLLLGKLTCECSINGTQLIGAPLYWINRELYYAYMALTKQSFALFITTLTQWWGPTTIRISGDASVADQIRKTDDGLVEFSFPERIVMIANHQVGKVLLSGRGFGG
jgi:hypothetical protein